MRIRRRARLDTSQIEDRRGMSGGRGVAIGGGGLGLVVALVLIVLNLAGGGGGSSAVQEAFQSLSGVTVGAGSTPQGLRDCQTGADAQRSEDCRIVAYVNSIQDYWGNQVRGYRPAPTVLLHRPDLDGMWAGHDGGRALLLPRRREGVHRPRVLPGARRSVRRTRGPLAEAYVLAHEYGHHVQDLTGVLDRVRGNSQGPESGSVRLELQADCYAGVWTAHAVDTGYLTKITDQDVADALDAAAAVGDDRIQSEFQGRVNPETWTHGSSAERQHWYRTGYTAGDPNACDTFSGQIS